MATDAELQSVPIDDPGEHQKLKKLGKYVVQRRLGAGGMGTVFLAVDSELKRTVALKVLPKERASNPKLVQRFKSEGHAAARLEHENIVKVYEAGESNGFLYIALEYVDGTDVEDLVRKRTILPVKRSISIIRQVALALDHAHDKGIVHRDIKPSNLMISKDGHVKLADMGLARAIDDSTETNITQAGMTVGTVDYMSPEQARDSKLADIRSDIYSLGCTWYHMLTGSPPFTEGSVTGKMGAHASKPPPNPRSVNENTPEAVVAVMHRMMAKDPKDRYQTPQELLSDLNQAMLGRKAVGADVLAGLAESESNWEHPVVTEDATETVNAGAAGTTTDKTRKPKDSTSQKVKTKRRKQGDANGNPQSRRPPRSAPSRKSRDTLRELPPRSENPEQLATSQKKLDLDQIKVLVIIFVGACVLGGVGWAVVRMNSSMNNFGEGGTLNPYRPEMAPPGEHEIVDNVRPPSAAGDVPSAETEHDDEPNGGTTRVNQYRETELFAGAERSEDVPEWLIDARAALNEDLTRVVVSLDEEVAADHRSIAAALDRLPAAGGIVELAGRGPFPLQPRSINNLNSLAIRARPGSRPVIVLDVVEMAPQREWLSFRGNTLELSGVHLVVSGRQLAASAAAVHVASGALLMRDTSLTITAPAPRPVTAIRLGDQDSTGARCLLENTFFRGSQLTAVQIASSAVNVVSGNSLLSSGDAPAIAILPDVVAARADAEAKESVTVSLFATVVNSANAIFEIGTENPERTPQVTLRGQRTVFAAGSAEAVWMRITNWPEDETGSLSSSRVKGLSWAGEQFSLLGWSNYIQFQSPLPTEPLLVREDDGWRRFWSAATDSQSFVRGEYGPQTVPPDRVVPHALSARIETMLAESDADRGALGLDVGGLPPPPESLIDRLRAEGARPRVPAQFSVSGRRTVTFDLSQGARLDEFLNSSDCPDGAIVQLTGSGRQIRPIVLRNKSVRLVFPAGSDAVSLRPIQTTGDERPAAFIRVEGGSIDLVNAHLTIPSSARVAYPVRVLQVIDGSFTLDRCLFTGQFRDGAQDAPIVEWTRETADAPQFASIRNSLIAGKFQAVSADLSNRLLACDNSIFTSLGDTCNLFAGTVAAPAYASLSNCTFSAGNSAFLARTSRDSPDAPINCFVERCVFAPPPESTAAGSVLLTHSAGAPADQSIVWWGSHNGFAPHYRRFHQIVDSPTAGNQNIEADWVRLWGVDHIWYPLTGPTAVRLAARLPEPDRVAPDDYALAELSEANRWGPGGDSIGARVDEIGPNGRVSDAASPAAPRTPRPTQTDLGF